MPIEAAACLCAQLQVFQATGDGFKTSFTPNEHKIIIDTGASISITNCKEDFMDDICPVQKATLQGIASSLSIKVLAQSNIILQQTKEISKKSI